MAAEPLGVDDVGPTKLSGSDQIGCRRELHTARRNLIRPQAERPSTAGAGKVPHPPPATRP